MVVLNVFKMILIFYSLLHSFKHLAAKEAVNEYSFSDYPEPEDTLYYHIKEAERVTSNSVSTKRRQLTLSRKTTKVIISPNTHSKIFDLITTPQWSSTTSSISTSTSSSSSTKEMKINISTYSTPTNYTMSDLRKYDSTRGSKQLFLYDTFQKPYTNFSVLMITPACIEQLNEILDFEYKNQDYNFWSHRRVLDAPLVVLLPPNDTSLRNILRQHKIDYMLLTENLQNVLDYERERSVKQINPSLTGISFNMYLRYDFIMDYLTHLSLKYPERARLIKIGKTVEDRDITVIEIKDPDPDPSERIIGAVLLQAGMHGREWLGVSSALYVIHQLVEHAAANKDMFGGIFWYILPVLNADGYEYSQTSDRLWKNNRKQYENCTGVDLDRNFEVRNSLDNKPGRKYKCTNLYAGGEPGSEPETKALKRFVNATKTILKVYVSLHSGDAFIGYPWAYKSERPTDYEQIVELANAMKKGIEKKDNSTKFAVDRLYSLCGVYDGAAIDWAKQEGILYPFMVSLKGGWFHGFNVPNNNIFDAVVAAFEGIRAIANHLQKPENMSITVEQTDPRTINNSSASRFFVLGILIWLMISCVM